jgi:hypothetical protein
MRTQTKPKQNQKTLKRIRMNFLGMEQTQKKVTAKEKLKQIWTNINETLKGGKKLYHCTSEQNAQSIERGGFRPGSHGIAGGGIYFAETPADALRKAHNHGAVLKCRVKLGKVLDVAHEGDSSLTLSEVKRLGCDSVRIPRFGAEYCVYEPSRAKVVGRNQANDCRDEVRAMPPGLRGIASAAKPRYPAPTGRKSECTAARDGCLLNCFCDSCQDEICAIVRQRQQSRLHRR